MKEQPLIFTFPLIKKYKSITSELNEGATFDIYLPIVEAGSN